MMGPFQGTQNAHEKSRVTNKGKAEGMNKEFQVHTLNEDSKAHCDEHHTDEKEKCLKKGKYEVRNIEIDPKLCVSDPNELRGTMKHMQTWGLKGEIGQFDSLEEAKDCANNFAETTGQQHIVVDNDNNKEEIYRT